MENRDLHLKMGSRIGSFRKSKNLTISGLAKKAGISKGSLSVLEDGRGNPTISTIWRLANALEVSFGEIASYDKDTDSLMVKEHGVLVKLIEKSEKNPLIETFLMKLEPNTKRDAEPHPDGVVEKLMVLKGFLKVGGPGFEKKVITGDDLRFEADGFHYYKTESGPATAIVSVIYPKKILKEDLFTRIFHVENYFNDHDIYQFIQQGVLEVVSGVSSLRLVFRLDLLKNNIEDKIAEFVKKTKSKNIGSFVRIFISKNKDDLILYIFEDNNIKEISDHGSKDEASLSNFQKKYSVNDSDPLKKIMSLEFFENKEFLKPGSFVAFYKVLNIVNSFKSLKKKACLGFENDFCFQLFRESFSEYGTDFIGLKSEEDLSLLKNDDLYDLVFIPDISKFNVFDFFEKSKKNLKKEGVLAASCECLSFFENENQMYCNFLAHHFSYMLDMLAHILNEKEFLTEFKNNNSFFYLKNELPVLMYKAKAGLKADCIKRFGDFTDVIDEVSLSDNLPKKIISFVNYLKSETTIINTFIKSLSNKKTYFENLVFIAKAFGFKLKSHEKVYATTGKNSNDGGIHVFSFSREK